MRKQIKKILVPMDGSPNSMRALNNSIKLAKKINATITGLFIVPESPTELEMYRLIAKKVFFKQYSNFAKKARQRCKKNDVRFIDIIEYGREGPSIVSYAEKNKFDLIVMGSRGLGSVKEFFLGSISNYVIHKTKIPVLLVK